MTDTELAAYLFLLDAPRDEDGNYVDDEAARAGAEEILAGTPSNGTEKSMPQSSVVQSLGGSLVPFPATPGRNGKLPRWKQILELRRNKRIVTAIPPTDALTAKGGEDGTGRVHGSDGKFETKPGSAEREAKRDHHAGDLGRRKKKKRGGEGKAKDDSSLNANSAIRRNDRSGKPKETAPKESVIEKLWKAAESSGVKGSLAWHAGNRHAHFSHSDGEKREPLRSLTAKLRGVRGVSRVTVSPEGSPKGSGWTHVWPAVASTSEKALLPAQGAPVTAAP